MHSADDKEEQHVRFLIYLAATAARHTSCQQYYLRKQFKWVEHVVTLILQVTVGPFMLYVGTGLR